ncbi:MAG: TIGR02391 family protein [Candidatus Omnitrophica bacterium]|nr:TIGR02391 family protein [Candidatus Omnitrophota bacterium]
MSSELKDVLLPPDELLLLEPEEIAAFLLDYLCGSVEQQRGHLNRHNFTLNENISRYAGDKTNEVGKAIMEAWCWLEKEGMIAPTPNMSGSDWRYVTKKGFKYRKKVDLDTYKKNYLLHKEALDGNLFDNVYNLFIRGDYDTAVFRAYKEVEVRVREKAGLPDDLLGVNLMRTAFNPDNGRLTDVDSLPAERQATSDLFAGSIGLFKNPSSHRKVNLSDPNEAAEIILFANYLLRIIDRCDVNSTE